MAWLSSLTSSSRTSTSLYRDLALTSQLPGSRPTVVPSRCHYAVDLEKYRGFSTNHFERTTLREARRVLRSLYMKQLT